MHSPNLQTTPEQQPHLLSPEMTIAEYKVVGHLATTQLSEVSHAINIGTGEPVALKVPLTAESAQFLSKEIAMHQRVDHPGIVTMDGHGIWRERPILATRLQENGTLSGDLKAGEPTGASTIASVIELFKKDIQETPTQEFEALDQPELVEVVDELFASGLPAELAEELTHDIDPEAVIEVVVEAASNIGHNMDPESLMAKETTLKMLEQTNELQDNHPDIDAILRRISILRGVAEGVVALHKVGLVHRDIKPANIGINKEGEGVLLDLGIAAPESYDSPMVVGSVGENIPPEGYEGHTLSAGDAWALGATAYRAMTGELPFDSAKKDPTQSYYNIVNRNLTAPRLVNAAVPRELSDVTVRALNRDPSTRPTVAEMHDVFAQAA